MANTAQRFHLGDLLSVTTGVLVSPDRMDGIYRILNYMTGDNLFTHQLPRACRQVAPEILRQHPAIADITLDAMTPEQVPHVLASLVKQHGEWFTLIPMQGYEGMDPLGELMSMTDKPIIPVKEPTNG